MKFKLLNFINLDQVLTWVLECL